MLCASFLFPWSSSRPVFPKLVEAFAEAIPKEAAAEVNFPQ